MRDLLKLLLEKRVFYTLIISSFAVSLVFLNIFASHSVVLKKITEKVNWVTTKDRSYSTSYYRTSFESTAEIKNAWIAVGAKDSFELIVNGNTAGRFFYWRPTRPFQNGLSESGQRMMKSRPALSLNYPREYQWTGHKGYKLPVYFDLGPYLTKGRNTIAMKVESRGSGTAFYAKGEVLLSTGERISIGTDETSSSKINSQKQIRWYGEILPKTQKSLHWGDKEYIHRSWKTIKRVSIENDIYRTFPEEMFSKPFEADLITTDSSFENSAESDGIWFLKSWNLIDKPVDAWIRIYANRNYSAFINGIPLKIPSFKTDGQDSGEWIVQTKRGQDLPAEPELLDPDEIGEYFSGSKFENTPHGDPTLNNFKSIKNNQNQTKESPYAYLEDKKGDEPSHRGVDASGFDPRSYRPGSASPLSLKKKRSEEKFFLYSIRSLLRKGENSISIRVNNPSPVDKGLKLGLDGKAYFEHIPSLNSDGQNSVIRSDKTWKYKTQAASGQTSKKNHVLIASSSSLNLPKKEYRGNVYSFSLKFKEFTKIFLLVFSLFSSIYCFLFKKTSNYKQLSEALLSSLYFLSLIIYSFLLLQSSFVERHEKILFLTPVIWIIALFLSSLIAFIVFWRISSSRNKLSYILEKFINYFQKKDYWPIVVFISLLACFLLRAFKLDFQPLDDDEYSSTQAILAISNSGIPKFNEDIWYTRSPLYHYLVGVIVRIFGENLWSLRLPSVIFAVLTAFLIYIIGKEFLKSKWVGLAAMIIYILHPFAIYSSHIARFYQQQQFFYCLTVYLFIKGFVVSKNQSFAYLTLLSFLCAVLSQEISILLGLQLALAYLVFGLHRTIKDELRLVFASFSVVLLIAIDLIIFQTKCLTRLEGVSPNLEATIALNFTSPMNFLSLFIAYSRLHIPLAIFFFLGIPFCLKRNNLNVLILYYFTLSGVLLTNILVTGLSLRYQYSLIPFFILLSVYGSWILAEVGGETFRNRKTSRHKWFTPLSFSVFFILFILSFSPWRISGSYDEKILGDSTGALAYVRENLRAEDKIAITEPHPHAAKIELGKVDYDLAIPLLYDFSYLKNGELVDRNGGAKIISSAYELQEAISKHERLWVLVNREKFRSRGKNIRWEYPGARAELFLRKNFEVKYETYLWTVFLWDAKKGRYSSFRKMS